MITNPPGTFDEFASLKAVVLRQAAELDELRPAVDLLAKVRRVVADLDAYGSDGAAFYAIACIVEQDS